MILVLSAVSFATCVLLTPLARRLGLMLGAVDHPDRRRVHSEPIPSLGGAAIFGAFMVPLLAAYFMGYITGENGVLWSPRLLGFLVCSTVLFLLGVLDDVRGLSSRVKFPVEIALACAMYFSGFAVNLVTVPMIGSVELGLFALPFTVLWFVGMANAMNLIDGMDGAAAGIAAIAALALASATTPTGNIKPILLAVCLVGASGGFLVHNFPPARVFMGDSGSLFLGWTLATVATMTHHKSTAAVAMLVPIAALAVPIADTTSAMVRRALYRRPIFSADSGHVHHRLLALGLSPRR